VEFVLIPLFAIAVITFGIYKLAELVFHIHLACRLLMLLVGFAWLVSLVMPGLFFHSAGFLGSLGISLVSALGFAWVAATYDMRTQASRSLSNGSVSEPLHDEGTDWMVSTEASLSGRDVEKGWPAIETRGNQDEALEIRAGELPEMPFLPVETAPDQPDLSAKGITAFCPIPLSDDDLQIDTVLLEESRVPADSVQYENILDGNLDDNGAPAEPLADIPAYNQDSGPDGNLPKSAETFDSSEIAEAAYNDEPEGVEKEQPASDSLEDLLEYAFAQRSLNNPIRALETFRLVKLLYLESEALPMVVAEIVSTLQSQGDYEGASAELAEILLKSEIRKQGHLVRVFENKLTELLKETDTAVR